VGSLKQLSSGGPRPGLRTLGDRLPRHDLIKRLIACNHAKLAARALLERLHAALQIVHFGCELPIALAQVVILGSLRRDRALETPQLAKTVFREPDPVLQKHHDEEQGCAKPFHMIAIVS